MSRNLFSLCFEGKESFYRNLSFENIGFREHFEVENDGSLSRQNPALLLLITPDGRVETVYVIVGEGH